MRRNNALSLSTTAIRLHDDLRALSSTLDALGVCADYFAQYADNGTLDESDFLWAVQWGLFGGNLTTARKWCGESVTLWFNDLEDYYWELGY